MPTITLPLILFSMPRLPPVALCFDMGAPWIIPAGSPSLYLSRMIRKRQCILLEPGVTGEVRLVSKLFDLALIPAAEEPDFSHRR